MQKFYVYILKCSDGSYYTGQTSNIENRLAQHQNGLLDCYTFSRRPVTLVFSEEFLSRSDAFKWERQIKGWTRKKKEALIAKNWNLLSALSKKKNDPSDKHAS